MRIDNRFLLIILLIFVYLYGWQFLAWEFDYQKLIAIFLFGLLTQVLFCLAFKIPVNALISTVITTMLMGLLIRTEFIFICGMISFFAVASKYIFQFRGKHLFNPANFGLVFMMLFTNQAFITNHRADHILIGFFVLGSLAILYRTNRRKLDVIVAFIFFSLLARGFVSSIGMDSALLYAQEVWYLIYVFLLIADPLSNPNSRIGRMSWVFIIVLSTQIFVYGLGVQYGHFYALAVAGLFMPLIDYVCKKEAVFSWDSVYKRELHSNAVLPS